jgi:hypothetical protein
MKGGALQQLQSIHISGGNLNFQNVLARVKIDVWFTVF